MALKPRLYDGPRMADLAGEGESAWLASRLSEDLSKNRRVLAIHGWTHAPSRLLLRGELLRILSECRARGAGLALQVSVTGLGGTVVEPGIGRAETETQALGELVDRLGMRWDGICARIDPLQRFEGRDGRVISNLERAPSLLASLAGLGVNRFRTSVIQYAKYRARIDRRLRERGLRFLPLTAGERADASEALLREAERRGAQIRSCASELPGMQPGACFDPAWLASLSDASPEEGAQLSTPGRAVAPRPGCLCFSPPFARLFKVPARSPCLGGCAACYACR